MFPTHSTQLFSYFVAERRQRLEAEARDHRMALTDRRRRRRQQLTNDIAPPARRAPDQ